MNKNISTAVVPETAVLIGLITQQHSEEKAKEHLKELAFLAETAGAVPLKSFFQRLPQPDSRFFVGSGKIDEIEAYVKENKIDMAIFDDELSPSQIRNIERKLNCKILDRNNLILDIFAGRARTAHARTQVELAQYQYLLPRLTRMWTHLERQKGGIGLRGPGEKEIETDRRIIRDKIALLKEKLKAIDKQNNTQRGNRHPLVRVALVGYTNVGKSTLMNVLSKSEVFAENKLFATLDTTVRKVVIDTLPFLLSDTVGFIRKLPHTLVESFKSTLDEVREADLLLHIVDISHSEFEDQIAVVRQTLQEIGASEKPVLYVFNKIDMYTWVEKDPDDLLPETRENLSLAAFKKTWIANENLPCVFISATKKTHFDVFRKVLAKEVRKLHNARYPFNKNLG